MKQNLLRFGLIVAVFSAASCATAPTALITVPMHLASVSGEGAPVGEIVVRDAGEGVRLTLNLHGLPPGDHGFHLHAGGSCDAGANAAGAMVAAGAAGGHFDPDATGHHEGPMGHGHVGDLPLIHVAANGQAHATLYAERLHGIAALHGRALVIHAGGDNYSDTPAPFGGGGARIACGIVP